MNKEKTAEYYSRKIKKLRQSVHKAFIVTAIFLFICIELVSLYLEVLTESYDIAQGLLKGLLISFAIIIIPCVAVYLIGSRWPLISSTMLLVTSLILVIFNPFFGIVALPFIGIGIVHFIIWRLMRKIDHTLAKNTETSAD